MRSPSCADARQLRPVNTTLGTDAMATAAATAFVYVTALRWVACDRLGLNKHKVPLSIEQFHSPKPRAEQLSLFG